MTHETVERTKAYRFALSDENGSGSATVARVGVRDPFGDSFLPGAFKSAVGKTVPLLASHMRGPDPPLGTIKVTGEDGDRVKADFAFNDTGLAQEWRKAAKTHGVELSVGVRIMKKDMQDVDLGGGRVGWDIKKVQVREISLTALGMQPGTGVSRVKSDAAPVPGADTLFRRSLEASALHTRTLQEVAK